MGRWIAGVDGFPGGWFRSSMNPDTGEMLFHAIENAAELITQEPCPSVLAIDIPIGLTDGEPRECDLQARKLLGSPRASSVFQAPIRPALRAKTQAEASELTRTKNGQGIAAQAFGIFPKVREVDYLLQSTPSARSVVYEVHPEICFWALSGEQAMSESKKSFTGQLARMELIESWLGSGTLSRISEKVPATKKVLATDDVLDSLVALWTAVRILNGEAASIPTNPPIDSTGLPMRMVY